jgi:hypothetical protein
MALTKVIAIENRQTSEVIILVLFFISFNYFLGPYKKHELKLIKDFDIYEHIDIILPIVYKIANLARDAPKRKVTTDIRLIQKPKIFK